MSTADPPHLVEYYILQQWVAYEPSQNGLFGKIFLTDGIEYLIIHLMVEHKI
jgi:endo-1,4-beta-xylanase